MEVADQRWNMKLRITQRLETQIRLGPPSNTGKSILELSEQRIHGLNLYWQCGYFPCSETAPYQLRGKNRQGRWTAQPGAGLFRNETAGTRGGVASIAGAPLGGQGCLPF